MILADQIINLGPWDEGAPAPSLLPSAAALNQLRNELLELRQLRAAAQQLGRYRVEATTTWLTHDCDHNAGDILDGPVTLAELVRRADEHGKDCR